MPLVRCKVSLPILLLIADSNPLPSTMANRRDARSRRPRPVPPDRQWYDDNGAPISGGCRFGTNCDFVHPSQAQWTTAPKPRQGYTANRKRGAGDRDGDRGRGRGWDRDRDRDRDGGESGRSTGRFPGTSTNALPVGPRRRESEVGAASSSGWGTAPVGGQAWGEDGAQAGASAGANPPAAASSSSAGASWGNPSDWGNPSADWSNASSGWGDASNDSNQGWGGGDVDFSSWADPDPAPAPLDSSTSGRGVPPQPPSTAEAQKGWDVSAPTKPPEHQEPVRPTVSTSSKGKEREGVESPVAISPQIAFHTPQAEFTTPRTPRSPNPTRSPEEPRGLQYQRRNTSLADSGPAASADDQAIATKVASHMRNEREGLRMSSFGVPVSTASAGPAGASSSKMNPFAFPQYTPAENMQMQERGELLIEEQDTDMADETGVPAAQDQAIPEGLKAQWKDFTRNLSRAVTLQLELRTHEDKREKQRKLQHSRAYQSGSMVDVHRRLEKMRANTESTIAEKRKHLDACLDKLVRYPLQGLPVPSPEDNTRENELQLVRDYVSQINGWLDQIRPMVQQHQEALKQAQEMRQREEEERRKAEEEKRKAHEEAEALAKTQLDKAKWAPIDSERVLMSELKSMMENMDERVTDLECGVDDLRNEGPGVKDIVLQKLEERGYKQKSAPLRAQSSIEDGEVVPEPPRSLKELKEEVTDLRTRFEKANGDVAKSMEELEARKQRGLAQKRDYYELARDNASLSLKVDELVKADKQNAERCASNEKAIAELREMLDKHGAAQPPPIPPHPTAEDITEMLRKPLLDDLLAVAKRAVDRLKSGVEESMKTNEELICRQLFIVLQPALAMVDTVKPVIDRYPDPHAHPQTQAVVQHS
ncbi:hypothetical protein BD310DRAFT_943165 [Dichomitus squalens]|uniref:C3H1-type domain-containing protein n=1 Tax=Dichomitus squalens TaxID=114155 RepID=A0A4Q9QD55_9APHY|nr:hypothetical protein BD310DRAFT_943165 [Dichomitus squalens]